MKKTIPALLFATLMILFANNAQAQAKWAKNVAKTTFTLKTFAANGNLIGSCCGFYVGTDGEAVANFAPFKGASRAVVIDANGVEQQVECIIGANDIYDVAKFKVSASKTQPVTLAASALQKDNIAWFMPYAVKKTPEAVMGTVTRVEQPADKYSYYTLQMQVPETAGGCPVLNDNGEVVGIMQQPASGDKDGYATDVRMATDLTAKPLMINDPTLSQTMLKKALPDDIKEATVTLMTMQTMADSLTLATTIDDFIKKFPNSSEGYKSRAQSHVRAGRHADADRDMQQAIKTGTELDDTYYTYARMIYSHQLYEQPEKQYAPWTLEFAEDMLEFLLIMYSTNGVCEWLIPVLQQ